MNPPPPATAPAAGPAGRRGPRSLQGRLLAGLLGAVLVVWGATAAVTWQDARHELDELLDGHLAQAAALLVAQQARAGEHDGPALDAPQLHRYAPRVAFQVWHAGRLALRSDNAPATPMVDAAALAGMPLQPRLDRRGDRDGRDSHHRRGTAADDDDRAHDTTRDRRGHADDRAGASAGAAVDGFRLGFHSVVLDGTAWRVFAAQGAEQDLRVFVGEQQRSRTDILLAVLRSTLWPLALGLPLLGAVVWWVVRQGTAPLRRLAQQLARRAPSDLSPLPTDGLPAEMAAPATALNGLFARIAGMVAAERRFTADAAHELRTPIAAIRTQAQVALAASDDDERRHALRATLAGCDRATRLVEQLLTLSRLEAGDAPPRAPVDLAALARRVLGELAPAALARRQQLGLDAPEGGCRVDGNETLLAVLLRNLVDNALRYSPDGAEVRVALAAPPGGGLRLTVDDAGPGLSDADRQRLGERFFRVLGTAQPGSGLGWSIVRRIAAAHGATVAVDRSAALGGLAVEVAWPAPR